MGWVVFLPRGLHFCSLQVLGLSLVFFWGPPHFLCSCAHKPVNIMVEYRLLPGSSLPWIHWSRAGALGRMEAFCHLLLQRSPSVGRDEASCINNGLSKDEERVTLENNGLPNCSSLQSELVPTSLDHEYSLWAPPLWWLTPQPEVPALPVTWRGREEPPRLFTSSAISAFTFIV